MRAKDYQRLEGTTGQELLGFRSYRVLKLKGMYGCQNLLWVQGYRRLEGYRLYKASLKLLGPRGYWELYFFWFGFCGIGAATDRTSPDIFHYRNLKLPHCETIARQFDWLFSCAVYSPVNLFLTLALSQSYYTAQFNS